MWYPRKLLRQAVHRPLSTFVAGLNARFLLLIVLDEEASELALGLRTPDALQSEASPLVTQEARLRPSLDHPSAPEQPSPDSMQAERLPAELLRRPCHVMPIAKRDTESFLQHVSVGRARNHDVVLRHSSVSKFHAWFELHADGRLFVKDCGSSNHTLLDGRLLEERSEVRPGQTVKFGRVECRVCSPQSVWTALQGPSLG